MEKLQVFTILLKVLNGRVKDVEISELSHFGLVARSQSHKWTVYVRGATNENLGAIVKRVVFQLHPSFNNPVRVIDTPPFELSECGWGEFEILNYFLFINCFVA